MKTSPYRPNRGKNLNLLISSHQFYSRIKNIFPFLGWTWNKMEPDSLVPLTFHPPTFNCPKMLTGVLQVNLKFCYQNCSTCCDKNCSSDQWSRKTYDICGWRPRICKIFEIIRTVYSNSSDRSEQFLVTECFFNLFLEVSQTWWIRKIRIQIGKNYWNLEICRKS